MNQVLSNPTLPSRVFMNGNSQAVRIPQEFRLDAQRVEITRTPSGDLLIHPIAQPEDRGMALLRALSAFDDDLIEAIEASHRESNTEMQDRDVI
ncbi:antitoxin [Vitreoscilla filiformis]|jgi:antitoxin VapB|uniref:Antitoxin n=1 Tax=Vitreoscilla filiformis TaxID=63 RepID=A0A221KHF2_VITFI|nr:AbrB/MazE/SpoVT family DNA-binding domain-containing protein [Vitreoscilla filiformis]ASM78471.1 antitoxin [Vitreoscilla filiformis]